MATTKIAPTSVFTRKVASLNPAIQARIHRRNKFCAYRDHARTAAANGPAIRAARSR